jgi:hypothetical protein
VKQQAAMLHCELPTTFDYRMNFSRNNFMCFLKSYQIVLTKEQG